MPKRSAIAVNLQGLQFDGEIGGGEHHPHEEFFGFDVVELLRAQDVLPVMGEKGRYRGDDARAIGQDRVRRIDDRARRT